MFLISKLIQKLKPLNGCLDEEIQPIAVEKSYIRRKHQKDTKHLAISAYQILEERILKSMGIAVIGDTKLMVETLTAENSTIALKETGFECQNESEQYSIFGLCWPIRFPLVEINALLSNQIKVSE